MKLFSFLKKSQKKKLRNAIEIPDFFDLLNNDSPLILEIGANDGATTLEFVSVFPQARIFAFEPEPRAIDLFKERQLPNNIKLIEMAIGAHTGTTEFFQSGGEPPKKVDEVDASQGWHLSGSIRQPKECLKEVPWVTFDSKIEIPICTLDHWSGSENITAVDLIWADVQGAEADLIAGASETLAKTKFLYTEYDDRELYQGQVGLEEIVNLLPSFEIVEIFRHDVLLRNKDLS
ncbi:FkbM family methyltransferase [Alphaproteobacteria bacterium]|nr:FkbM family methyltransferase [Alphaproteobacteria bacterium]